MHIQDIFKKTGATLSFEFFPPRTAEGADTLFQTIAKLEAYKPDFVSVTYGAGGSTRQLTHDLVSRIKKETTLDPVPHLTCVCHKQSDIEAILARYAAEGVHNILALGGDPPRNLPNYDRSQDDFQHAADLVRFIRRFDAHSHGFGIGVAGFPEGHPATPNRLKEMDYLKAKVDLGANYIVTQLFFDARDFIDFRERCELAGITIPIIAGVMPIDSVSGMKRMAELSGGTRFPAKLLKGIASCKTEQEVRAFGIRWATEQCRELIDSHVRGLHLYTLNHSGATRAIIENLGAFQAGSR